VSFVPSTKHTSPSLELEYRQSQWGAQRNLSHAQERHITRGDSESFSPLPERMRRLGLHTLDAQSSYQLTRFARQGAVPMWQKSDEAGAFSLTHFQ